MKPVIAAAAALMLVMPTMSGASSIPSNGILKFDVLRDGTPVGSHTIAFSDGGQSVDIKTDIAVKMLFVTVYRFEHNSHETWRGDQLVALESKTNEDGTDHTLSVKAGDAALNIVGDGVTSSADPSIVPASLWREETVRQNKLLNTLKGTQMKISVTDAGNENIEAGGKTVTAHHYVLKGDLARELWYGSNGVLEQVRFSGKDGSNIVYHLE